MATLVALLAAAAGSAIPASGSGAGHGAVVAETPELSTPRFLDGDVRAGAQVGNRIVVGGDFTRIADAGLGTVDQAYLAAYDVHTGRLDPNFRPELDDLVDAVADGGEGAVLIGGRFRSIDGLTRQRVARLRLVDGSVVTSFTADANAQVYDIAVAGGTAYLAGRFASVNGVPRSRLAAVDLHTGEIDGDFDLPVTDPTGWEGSSAVRAVDISPDGSTLAIAHNNATIAGLPRQGVGLIDIGKPTAAVLPWRTTLYDYDCQPWYPQFSRPLMRDVAFSPDGSFLVVASAIGNYAPGCDVIVRFPTNGRGDVRPDWVSRVFDTPETVAVSDAAVYTGGHMRWAMAPGTAWTDYADGNSDEQPDGTVIRDQILALSPADGTALPWDPGAGGLRGVLSLETVQAGLLAGSDGDRWGGAVVGRHALFPPATAASILDGARPDSSFIVPLDGDTVGRRFPLIVESTDDTTIADVSVTIRDVGTGRYLQPDGTFRTAATDLSPLVIGTGTDRAVTKAYLDVRAGRYVATATAVDAGGRRDRSPATIEFRVTEGPGTTPPDGWIEHPGDGRAVRGVVTLNGLTWDDSGVERIRMIVKDLATGEFLQRDGRFAPRFRKLFVRPDARGATVSAFEWTVTLPKGRYRALLFVKDDDGEKDPVRARVAFRVSG
jgi:hypothetical protein